MYLYNDPAYHTYTGAYIYIHKCYKAENVDIMHMHGKKYPCTASQNQC